MQIIDDPNSISRLFATGISKGVSALIDNQLQHIHSKKLKHKFEKAGYNPKDVGILAHIAQNDPKSLMGLLQALSSGQQQQGQQFEGQEGQEVQPQEENFAQRLARGTQKGSAQPTIKSKHYDELVSHKQNLQDIVKTATAMKESLKNGVKSGVIASVLGKLAPSWLDQHSELFDKDSAHLVNLSAKELKGPASRYRVSILEKEKPSLAHSAKVNEKILDRFIEKASSNLKDINEQYPELENVGTSSRESKNEVETPQIERIKQELSKRDDPSKYANGTKGKFKGYIFEVQNGEFVYKGKQQ